MKEFIKDFINEKLPSLLVFLVILVFFFWAFTPDDSVSTRVDTQKNSEKYDPHYDYSSEIIYPPRDDEYP